MSKTTRRPPDADLALAADWCRNYEAQDGDDAGTRLTAVADWLDQVRAAAQRDAFVRKAVKEIGGRPGVDMTKLRAMARTKAQQVFPGTERT